MDTLTYVKDQIEKRPIEARLIRKVVKALKDAGTPVRSVWDGEERTPVSSTEDVLHLVFNLDEAHLVTEGNSWVYVVMGQDWDMITDYTIDIEEALAPVNEYVMKHG